MKKTLRRIISSILALVLAVSMIRVPVYAAEYEEEIVVTETEAQTGVEEEPSKKSNFDDF